MGDINQVEVQSLVMFSIFDDFIRRDDGNRVIGGLMGYVDETRGNVLVISDCFPLLHKEDGSVVEILEDYFSSMLFLKSKVREERFVGWYATKKQGLEWVDDNSCTIQTDFMDEQCSSPVHVVVDPSFDGGKGASLKGFVSDNVVLGGEVVSTVFREVGCEIAPSKEEGVALNQMIRGQPVPFSSPSSLATLPSSHSESVLQTLDTLGGMCDKLREKLEEGEGGGVAISREDLERLRQRLTVAMDGVGEGGERDLAMVRFLGEMSKLEAAASLKLNQLL